jgi:hypothetical protein
MRKWVLMALAAWLALGVATANADVFVFAEITKVKDKIVTETITKDKFVELFVEVLSFPDKFAESDTIVNQTNDGNEACENCAEKMDILRDSGNSNAGVLTINQAAGNMNNQGSAISIAINVEENGTVGFAEAQAAVQQTNVNNLVDSINILFRDALIEGSINDNSGVVHVNQSPGQMNNQANALSLAITLASAGGVALSEADLGQFNVGNTVLESNVFKTAVITSSVNNNAGVIGVNQSSGSMANQANVVSIATAQLP